MCVFDSERSRNKNLPSNTIQLTYGELSHERRMIIVLTVCDLKPLTVLELCLGIQRFGGGCNAEANHSTYWSCVSDMTILIHMFTLLFKLF